MEKITSSRRAILNALLEGRRLTAYDANIIGHTTAGARRIRQIREDYPVMKEPVSGEKYARYYMNPEWLAEWRKERKKPLRARIGGFFKDLLAGGMFEEAKA